MIQLCSFYQHQGPASREHCLPEHRQLHIRRCKYVCCWQCNSAHQLITACAVLAATCMQEGALLSMQVCVPADYDVVYLLAACNAPHRC